MLGANEMRSQNDNEITFGRASNRKQARLSRVHCPGHQYTRRKQPQMLVCSIFIQLFV